MSAIFESAARIETLRAKFLDEDLTLAREQVSFLFDYIEALELALDLAVHDDGDDDDEEGPHVLTSYIEEAMASLPPLGE